MLRFIRSLVGILKLLILISFGAVSLLIRRPHTRAGRAEWLHDFCVRLLRSLGVAVRQSGSFPERGVVISNHVSYLDIMALAALGRCVFVSKSEVRSWPVLGWMTAQAGTLYVRRGHHGSADRIRTDLCAAAGEGMPIVFFPEGTTTDGSAVLSFHSGLLYDSISCGLPITAAFIRYRLAQRNGAGVTVAKDVAYWDDMPFALHVFRLLGLRGIEVEIGFADAPIAFSAAARLNRKLAAAEARAAVMQLGAMAGV